jgi:hypothetical protein
MRNQKGRHRKPSAKQMGMASNSLPAPTKEFLLAAKTTIKSPGTASKQVGEQLEEAWSRVRPPADS